MRIVYLQLGPPSNEWEGEGDGGSLYWMLGEKKKKTKKRQKYEKHIFQ